MKALVGARSALARAGGGSLPAILLSPANRLTIRRIAAREIRTRVVGTMLGLAHYFIAPLFYLAIYTWLFSSVFAARWAGGSEAKGDFAMRVYAGLIVFQLFSDVLTRAPRLVLENPSYVTRIVFPLEVLVPAAILASLFAAAVNMAILLAGHLVLAGLPPVQGLSLLLIWPALLLFVAGLAWAFAALGVYVRDLGQFVSTAVPALLFLTPIFYPLSAIPPGLRSVLELNPLAWFVDATRGALLDASAPGPAQLALFYAVGLVSALAGHALFQRTKHGFADVL